MYIDVASPEDFVSCLLSLRQFGLDTVNWEVLPMGGKLDGRQVCTGRPPSPVARFTRPRAQPQFRGGEVLGRGVYWFRPLGILRRGREWEVATSCKRAPPLTGWERVSVDVVHELLLAHARRYYYMYWPRGLPEKPEELRHVAVFGVSMSGKTTFAKRMLGKLGHFYVIDITTHGEYTDLAPAVEGTILLSQFSLEELVKLYTIAMASVLGEEEKASLTAVQLGVLRRFSQHLRDVSTLLDALSAATDIPEMTKQVLTSKLSALCVEYEQYGVCKPHPAVMRPFKLPNPPAVIRIDPSNPLVTALVTHGIMTLLLKTQQSAPTYVIVDEFHRVMPKISLEDPFMDAVVAGRHRNIYLWISTQSPRHLRRDVLSTFPTQVFFQLREDADIAASLLGVPPEAVTSLKTGEWIAITPAGKRRWE